MAAILKDLKTSLQAGHFDRGNRPIDKRKRPDGKKNFELARKVLKNFLPKG